MIIYKIHMSFTLKLTYNILFKWPIDFGETSFDFDWQNTFDYGQEITFTYLDYLEYKKLSKLN